MEYLFTCKDRTLFHPQDFFPVSNFQLEDVVDFVNINQSLPHISYTGSRSYSFLQHNYTNKTDTAQNTKP